MDRRVGVEGSQERRARGGDVVGNKSGVGLRVSMGSSRGFSERAVLEIGSFDPRPV